MMLPKPVVLISPLLALLEDQHEKLQKLDIPASVSTAPCAAKRAAPPSSASTRGGPLLVMTTPETLGSPELLEALSKSGRRPRRRRRSALHLGVGPRFPSGVPAASASACARSAGRRSWRSPRPPPRRCATTSSASSACSEPVVVVELAAPLEPRVRGARVPRRHALARAHPLRAPAAPAGHHLLHDDARGRQRLSRCCASSTSRRTATTAR